MDTFKWNSRFSVGIKEIDAQHRALLELLNQCTELAGRGNVAVDPALVTRLKAYAEQHFRLEEKTMASMGYDRLDHHRTQHQYFESRVLELESGADSASSLAAFLRDWLIHHILGEDQQYVFRWRPTNKP